MTEAPFDLELYWGPEDGILMELPKIKSPIGIDRPETVYINNSVYKIFKASEFPNIKREEKKEENNSKNYPNIPFIGMRPTEKKAGDCMCVIGGEDDIVTYSFNHKDREGGVDHADMCICEEDLTTAIQQINTNFGDLERPIGFCWFHKCKATLYPEEIKGIVPDEVYEEYRKKFNKQMALKKGGSRNRTRKLKKYQKGGNKHSNRSILHPVDVNKITCWSPPNKKK